MRPLQLVDFYVHINSKRTCTISILFKDKVFAFQNYKKKSRSILQDLDLWDCNLDSSYIGRENPNL